MKTNNTHHLGDGAYVGLDPNMDQVWLGANHHENMTVALGAWEIKMLVRWLCVNGYRNVVAKGIPSND